MNLAAKASERLPHRSSATAGYAMAALLVGLSVMAILMSVAMPTWSQMIRREKEEELVFRGTQYARAINQYQRKFANASPATLDVLIEQRMLRKKFKDPLAPGKDGEFQMLYLGSATGSRGMGAGPGAGPVAGPGAGAMGRSSQAGIGTQSAAGTQTQAGSTYSTTPSGGIVGVTSKNTGTSIRIFKGKTKYNEWQFLGMEQSSQAGPGGGGPGGPQRGGPGGREGGAGGPGGRGGSGGGRGGSGGRGDFGGPGGFPGGSRGSGPSPQR